MAVGEVRCEEVSDFPFQSLSWRLWSLKKEKLSQNRLLNRMNECWGENVLVQASMSCT